MAPLLEAIRYELRHQDRSRDRRGPRTRRRGLESPARLVRAGRPARCHGITIPDSLAYVLTRAEVRGDGRPTETYLVDGETARELGQRGVVRDSWPRAIRSDRDRGRSSWRDQCPERSMRRSRQEAGRKDPR